MLTPELKLALHEAAHALAVVLYEGRVHTLTLQRSPDGRIITRCTWEDFADPIHELAALAAGPLWSEQAGDPDPWGDAGSDSDRADWCRVRQAHGMDDHGADVALGMARLLIQDGTHHIEAIAAALVERGTLTHEQIENILHACDAELRQAS